MKRFALTLDLKDDPKLIEEYKEYHVEIWPEITASIKDSGITDLQIYLLGTRMFMLMETDDDFTFERKGEMDKNNSKVQEWEDLMWKYQQALPMAKEGEKWLLMDKVFQLR